MREFQAYEIVLDLGDTKPGHAAVTVVVTLYNYAHHIVGALESAAAQTIRQLDLVVIDDCSTDRSLATARDWLETHGNRFSRARLLRNRTNYGLSDTRNIGFEAAHTEYVMVLDADNEMLPTAVERLLAACHHSGAAASYSIVEHFGEERHLGPTYVWDPERFARGNYVDAMALIRRDAWEAVGGYHQFEVAGWEDYDLWCGFVDRGLYGVFVPQILCRYRVHKRSMLRSETNLNYEELSMEITVRHPWLKL